MTEDEITELVKRLRGLLYMNYQEPPAYLSAIQKAADAIESLRASLANAEKEIADLKYRLEAARMFTEVGDELPGEAIERMKEIVGKIVLHRKVKK